MGDSMDKATTCCFAGHRKLPKDRIEKIIKHLNQEVDWLIAQGVTNFISGGDLGFDQLAASLILAKKEMGQPVRLVFILPCKNQEELWHSNQKIRYQNLLVEADEIVYLSEKYPDGCMKERNRYMIDQALYCVCALMHSCSGTEQTVAYAKKKGLTVINVTNHNLQIN
jgi:uncharacterized phage-like protein YoqJ